jgi:hypothetical protein
MQMQDEAVHHHPHAATVIAGHFARAKTGADAIKERVRVIWFCHGFSDMEKSIASFLPTSFIPREKKM